MYGYIKPNLKITFKKDYIVTVFGIYYGPELNRKNQTFCFISLQQHASCQTS